MGIFNNKIKQKNYNIKEFFIDEEIKINVSEKYYDHFLVFKNKDNIQYLEYKNFVDLSKDKNVLLDIGSHIGVFLFTFNSLGEHKESYGFDINPFNVNSFKDTLSHNNKENFSNITFYNLGVSDKIEDKKFIILSDSEIVELEGLQGVVEFDNDELVKQKYLRDYERENLTEKTSYVTIDSFSDHLSRENKSMPDVIKIDVEGYEEKVLDGGYKTFTLLKPLLFIEIHSNFLEFYNSSVENIYNKIIDYNYEFYDYNRKKIESLGEYQSLFENNPELRIYCLPKLRKGQ